MALTGSLAAVGFAVGGSNAQAAEGKPFLPYKPGYENYSIPEIVHTAQREGKLAEFILELRRQGINIVAPNAEEIIKKLEAQVTPMLCADYAEDKGGVIEDVHTYDEWAQQNGMIDRKCYPYEIVYVSNDTRAAVLAGSCSNIIGEGQMAIRLNPIVSDEEFITQCDTSPPQIDRETQIGSYGGVPFSLITKHTQPGYTHCVTKRANW